MKFEEYEEQLKVLKALNKQEDQILQKINLIVGRKQINKQIYDAYWEIKRNELLPIQEKILDLEKKIDFLIEEMIKSGEVCVKYCQIVGHLVPKIDGQNKYSRILLDIRSDNPF